MPDVEYTVPVNSRRRMRAVGRQQIIVIIVRTVVEGVGIGITRQQRQPMDRALGKGHLKAVVVGLVLVRSPVGEFGSKLPSLLSRSLMPLRFAGQKTRTVELHIARE